MIAILAFWPLLFFLLIVTYLRSIQKILSSASEKHRKMRPILVWLNLLPLVSIPWHVYTNIQVLRTIGSLSESEGLRIHPALVLLGGILSVFLGLTALPVIGKSIALVGLPLWLLNWVLILRLNNRVQGVVYERMSSRPSPDACRTGPFVWFHRVVPTQSVLRSYRKKEDRENALTALFYLAVLACIMSVGLFSSESIRLETWKGDWAFRNRIAGLEATVLTYAISSLVLLFLSVFLWFAKSGKKRMILFLRKFQREKTSLLLRRVFRNRRLRNYRLMTLDDKEFQPIKSNRSTNVLVLIAAIVAVVSAYPIFGLVSSYLGEGQKGWAQAQFLFREEAVFWDALALFNLPQFIESIGRLFGDVMSLVDMYVRQYPTYFIAFGTMYVGAIVAVGVAIVGYFLILIRLNVIAKFKVESEKDLNKMKGRIRKLGNMFYSPVLMAPQASIVSVASSIWQEAVLTLGVETDIVVIDLSEYTDNIGWEIDRMLSDCGRKCVFVGDGRNVADWVSPSQCKSGASTAEEIVSRLKSKTFVAYEASGKIEISELVMAFEGVVSQ